MKKKILTGALILVLGAGSIVAYADAAKVPNIFPGERNINLTLEDREGWFKERHQFRNERVKEALEKGLITEEEAKSWQEHFEYMDKYHSENGFIPGGCGMGFGRHHRGRGMMRGNRW